MSPGLPPRDTVLLAISKQAMKFSAAHFTLIGPGSRERLHGHDYFVSARLRARVGEDGLCFDYGILKRELMALCQDLDEYVLLPGESPLLRIERKEDRVEALFGDERIPFLASDVQVLPLARKGMRSSPNTASTRSSLRSIRSSGDSPGSSTYSSSSWHSAIRWRLRMP